MRLRGLAARGKVGYVCSGAFQNFIDAVPDHMRIRLFFQNAVNVKREKVFCYGDSMTGFHDVLFVLNSVNPLLVPVRIIRFVCHPT